MDSPERSPSISFAEAEGSPLFDFISTLSPIKPVKSAHVAQTFSEISFPPAVFVSPKADAEKGSRPQQRIQSKCSSEELSSSSEVRRLSLQTMGGRVFAMMSKRTQKSATEAMATSPCSSPSKLFEDYFCGPIEDEENKLNSSVVNPDGTGGETNANDDGLADRKSAVDLEWDNSASMADDREEDRLTEKEECNADAGATDRNDAILAILPSPENDDGFEFLISEVEEGLDWQTQDPPSTLSELAVDQVDSYVACLREAADGGKADSEVTYKCMENDESEGNPKKQDFNASRAGVPFQRGARRRCLDFEVSDNHVKGEEGTSGLVSISHAKAHSRAESVIGAKSVKLRLSSSKLVAQIGGSGHTSPVPTNMPSGIGLHLNSLAEGSFRRGIVVSVVEKPRMENCEQPSKDESERVINSSLPSRLDRKPCPLSRKRVLLSELTETMDSEKHDECSNTPQSPKKKRRLSSTSEKSGDGCKRCNCKKSKCLKLYCECFAAGVYCVDSCSCQGCFNKPEFEETVMETRQQIESRNPLAFAPKIVRATESSPSNTDDCHDTPASARHKRGCNCKKSHCLKKYCECYQAGVGCSDGCRCESCKNVYGKKEGAEDCAENRIPLEAARKEVEEQIHTSDCNDEPVHGYQRNHEISPVTPFESSGHSRITIKSTPSNSRCFPSEELHSPAFSLSSSSFKHSRSPSRLLRPAKAPQNASSPSVASSLPKVGSTRISTPRIMRIGQFSPRWDGLSDICTLTPLPQAPRRAAASASAPDGVDSSPSIKTKRSDGFVGTQLDPTNHLSSPSSHSQSVPSSVQCQTPAHIRGTPVTPLLTSACTTGKKTEACTSESDLIAQLLGSEDDQTPEFLKDHGQRHSSGCCSPVRFLNSNSPKHKRVSPPHHHHAAQKRQLQATNMTSRRKFILQSIPSIPPTPAPAIHEEAGIGSRSYQNDT